MSEDWDALADRTQAPPFLRPGWLDAWWTSFGAGSLELLEERTDGRLVAVMPLVRARGRFSSPTNWHTPEFGMLAEGDDERARLAGRLVDLDPRAISLSFVPRHGRGLEELRRVLRGHRYSERLVSLSQTPIVDLEQGLDHFLRTLPSKSLAGTLKRRRRRIERHGSLSLAVEDGRTRLAELLEEGFAVEASGWKRREGTAIASHPSTRAYYTDVAAHASAKGALRLFYLRLDDRLIGFQYAVVSHDTLYCVKAGYDEAYRAYGPGKLLMYDVIAWAAANGFRRCDLGGSEDPYKLEWTTSREELIKYEAWAPGPAGRLRHATQAIGRPIASRAKGGLGKARRAIGSAAAGIAARSARAPAVPGEPGARSDKP